MDRLPWALCAICLLLYLEITFDFTRNYSLCQPPDLSRFDCNKTFPIICAFTLSHYAVRFYSSCTPQSSPLKGCFRACVSESVRIEMFLGRQSCQDERWVCTQPEVEESHCEEQHVGRAHWVMFHPRVGESKHHLQTSRATPELQSNTAPPPAIIFHWLWRASKLSAPLRVQTTHRRRSGFHSCFQAAVSPYYAKYIRVEAGDSLGLLLFPPRC